MNALITHLENGDDLAPREIDVAANLLLDPSVDDAKKEALLLALAKKGESPGEIADFVEAFLEHAVDPMINTLDLHGPTLDVCGTGGDQLDLFNISTTSMFVAAAAGAIVVKHGNRGITSKSGGADVLEALGIRIDLPPEHFRHCIETAGVGFLFAPNYHPAFKAVAPVRKKLAASGHRTIFNLIGPLLNPARPQCQLVGVSDETLCSTFADILQRLGRESAWVVSGKASCGRGVDEVSLTGSTRICKAGSFQELEDEEITPEDFGFRKALIEDLKGGDAKHNAIILENILSGKETGPKLDIVLLNAAAAIACAGLADHLGDAIDVARESIQSGAAYERLILLQEASKA
ncbi:MAG: anthranilate phosphoribosyltransferase [Akkermansiaceae bacterium]|jgi:anthranilate phosphoribosyltransferase